MSEQVNVLVASQKEVKARATEDGFLDYGLKAHVSLATFDVDSGVPDQPIKLEDTALGALTRLKTFETTLESGEYDYLVAIEGGMFCVGKGNDKRWYESACAAVSAHQKTPSLAYGPAYPVPANLVKHIEGGLDLNQAMEIETGIKEIGRSVGFNGWLTEGKFDRQKASAIAVQFALFGLHHE